MIARTRALPAAAILVFLAGGTPLPAQNADVDAIKRVANGESEAFYRRDSIAFKRAWVQDSSAVIMYVGSDGTWINIGWDKFGPGIMELMRNSPTPVPIKLAASNHRVHIDGALAFVEYDATAVLPPDTTVWTFHQHRALVKRDGEWRIFSSGIYPVSTYNASPVAIEGRLNAVGSTLAGAKKNRDAIEVLKLNAQLFPNSPRVHQRLGEAYSAAGDTKLAIESYEKSLAIEPKNEVGKVALAKLRESKTP